jgi:two-component system CheB/CheR fusion protein
MQADGSLQRSQGGLGIGLSLVQRLVEMHGGTVEARSEGQGRGSEFIVRLPLREGRPEPVATTSSNPASRAPAAKAAPRRILVVEDNPVSAKTLRLLLEKMGHLVATAGDGEEAVTAADEFMPDLVLLDIGLPKIDGHEAARRIRRLPRCAGARLVAVTGWGQEEDRRRSREAGFDEHVVKPVDRGVLEHLLERLPPAADTDGRSLG